jgi:superfamily II DNA or RNA helicase
MTLRKHQNEFDDIIIGMQTGSNKKKTIYCHVCPGGGKSILPIMAGRLIEAGLAEKMAWIAPRLSLTDQAEREFVNPYFRSIFDHRLKIRQATNEIDPCRGLHGFSTTYNAVGMDEGFLYNEFKRHKYILICDEFHHLREDSLWHQKIAPLYDLAAYRIMMTGTLERGDHTKIAFVPYRGTKKAIQLFLQETEDTAIIKYSRADALAEQAIIPLKFHLSDGNMEWEDRRGRIRQVASIDKMSEYEANKALYTALKTEYADHLLSSGIAHWQSFQQQHKSAKCLVVTSNIQEAKRHMKSLEGIAARCDIATSDESIAALTAIKSMKQGKLDVIVTVAMAYEGLDIPEISHIICLTRIRSVPWIEQMIARANRINSAAGPYNQQIGHIFAPADPLFKQVISRIEAEQLPIIQEKSSLRSSFGEGEAGDSEFHPETAPGGINPLSSALTGKKEMIMGPKEAPEMTSSEIETDFLGQIENHIRLYCFQNRHNPKKLNAEIYKHFGKKRRDMTIPELEKCLAYILQVYPLSFVRGTGKSRVSTKAEPFPCNWR